MQDPPTSPRPGPDLRRNPRVPAGGARVSLRAWHPEEAGRVTTGEGSLSDLSERGLRIIALAWSAPLPMTKGTPFAFEVREGPLSGVSGVAYVAWSREGPGRSRTELGASLQRLEPRARWMSWAHAGRPEEDAQRLRAPLAFPGR